MDTRRWVPANGSCSSPTRARLTRKRASEITPEIGTSASCAGTGPNRKPLVARRFRNPADWFKLRHCGRCTNRRSSRGQMIRMRCSPLVSYRPDGFRCVINALILLVLAAVATCLGCSAEPSTLHTLVASSTFIPCRYSWIKEFLV
jgi:hypothetical protein